MSVAVQTEAPEDRPQPAAAPPLRRTGEWARRAPLLPALIFMIIVTQLPFMVTLVISFTNWNAYYPDERGFAGFDNFRRVFTDANMLQRGDHHDHPDCGRGAGQPGARPGHRAAAGPKFSAGARSGR